MRNIVSAAAGSVALLSLAQCAEDPYAALVRAHAPIHFQDTDSTSPVSDELTAINYDGNYVTTDNWDHLSDPSTWTSGTNAVVYRSVVETCTHWFVVYAMYHPRDWTDSSFEQEHENDVEGLLVAVTKDGTPTGRVDGVVTVFHTDFYSYTPAGSPWTSGIEDLDGTLTFGTLADGTSHPMTAQEAKGHGLKAWPYAGDFAGNPGEDGIVYIPGDVSQDPPSGTARDVQYTLVNLFDELWLLQLAGSDPFVGWGSLAGDESGGCGDGWSVTCSENAASMPWGWDDGDDIPGDVAESLMPRGMLALDPAVLVDAYFDGLGDFSLSYVSNRYLEDLRAQGYTDAFLPDGFPANLSLDEAYTRLDAVCDGRTLPAVEVEAATQ